MRNTIILAVAATFVTTGFALADCREDIAMVDQEMAAGTSLTDEDKAQAEALRNEGEAFCAAGDDAAAEERLMKVKELLGLT